MGGARGSPPRRANRRSGVVKVREEEGGREVRVESCATPDGPKWTAQSGSRLWGKWCEEFGEGGIGTLDGPKWTAQRAGGGGGVN